jgi:inosose dehydratase
VAQNRAEIDLLMSRTDPQYVDMGLGTGHVPCAGESPFQLPREYRKRIGDVHLKDVRKQALDRAVTQKFSFFETIYEGIFTAPDDPEGYIDFGPILDLLTSSSYRGWIVVEAEQVSAKTPPLHYALMARNYLRQQ